MSFHDLHHQGNQVFVLPNNAWDAVGNLPRGGLHGRQPTSFRLVHGGHPDGHRATRGANIALAAALAPPAMLRQ